MHKTWVSVWIFLKFFVEFDVLKKIMFSSVDRPEVSLVELEAGRLGLEHHFYLEMGRM